MKEVREIRKICGVKQNDVAKHLGMNQGNYCNLENGKLIQSNTPEMEKKALEFLLPILTEAIAIARSRLNNAKELKRKANKILSK